MGIHDGNVVWMGMSICRVIYRSNACIHEGKCVGETVVTERVGQYVGIAL